MPGEISRSYKGHRAGLPPWMQHEWAVDATWVYNSAIPQAQARAVRTVCTSAKDAAEAEREARIGGIPAGVEKIVVHTVRYVGPVGQ